MSIETQLYYIGASGVQEIRKGGAIIGWEWGTYGDWKSCAKPVAAKTQKVRYKSSAKSSNRGTASGWNFPTKQVTVGGSTINPTATRTIDGVERTVEVAYRTAGRTTYSKPKSLKKKKKMYKYTYTQAKPYYYQVRYKDTPKVETSYSVYQPTEDKTYVYFADMFFTEDSTKELTVSNTSPKKMMHPTTVDISFSDVRKNLDSSANNSDSRDNSGSYVFTNVRSNIVTLELEWTGLDSAAGQELVTVLNQTQSIKNNGMKIENMYLVVQYLDPQSGNIKNGTFYPSDRKVTKYGNGMYKSVSVTLTEV